MIRFHRLRPGRTVAWASALCVLLSHAALLAQTESPAPTAPPSAPSESTATPAPPPPPPESSAAPAAPAAPTAPLAVRIDVGESGLDREQVRAAIARELGAEVTLSEAADAPLRVTIAGDHVQVAYSTASGEALSRTVELPSDGEGRVEVIALMVGNLTRNEAADLLAELERNKPPPVKPAVVLAPSAAKPATPATPEPDPLIRASPAFNLALAHPLSLRPDSEKRVIKLELGLFYSRVGAIEGLGVNLGVLKVERHVRGVVFGTFTSTVNGPVRGIHGSLIYSGGKDRLDGISAAGVVVNQPGILHGVGVGGITTLAKRVEGAAIGGAVVVTRETRGGALAGIATIHAGTIEGATVAGAVALSDGLHGVGVAGIGQRHAGQSEGFVIAGLGNVTSALRGSALAAGANVTGELHGFALAGAANISEDVHGATLALVNVGRKVTGAQIGLVNVAAEVDGAQIGVVNVSKSGRVQLEGFVTNLAPVNVGLKFVSGYAYSEFIIGYQPNNNYVDFSPGIGAHLPLLALQHAAVELGVRGSFSYDEQTQTETPERMDLIYEGRVTYRVLPFLEPFAGGGVRHGLYGASKGHFDPEIFGGLALSWP